MIYAALSEFPILALAALGFYISFRFLQFPDLTVDAAFNAAHCFREITGKHCTATLILPGHDEINGDYLESVLYCNDTDPERTQNTQKQKGGLCHKAFNAETALLFNDYESEMKKGNFIQFRKDWRKWYASGFMCHFKAKGERWGVLNIDSPYKKVFHQSQAELIAAFADACGLVFNVCERENL